MAGSKNESIDRISEDSFFVRVKEKAEQNLANRRVLEIIAEYFKVTAKQVRIISGHHSPGKILSIPDTK